MLSAASGKNYDLQFMSYDSVFISSLEYRINEQLGQLRMKERLDILVAGNFGLTRSKAQALIMAGEISVNKKPATKSGALHNEDVIIEVKVASPYVSRGAQKLEKATTEFGIDFTGKTICDIGASTGGFSDYALQHGAIRTYAIDCGYGQLDQRLRADQRVINMERTNIKKVDALPEPIDIFVIDVSFISLKKVLPQVITIIKNSKTRPVANGLKIENCDIVALIKPQFEVGKKVADRYSGVITDELIRQAAVDDIIAFAKDLGFTIKGITDSPIKGAKGNKEFLLFLLLRA